MTALQQSCCPDSVERRIKSVATLLGLLVFLVFIWGLGHVDQIVIARANSRDAVDSVMSVAVFVLGSGVPFLAALVHLDPFVSLRTGVSARSQAGMAFSCWAVLSIGIALFSGGTSFYVLRFLAGMTEAAVMSLFFLDVSSWYQRSWRAVAVRYCGAAVLAVVGVTAIVMSSHESGGDASNLLLLQGFLKSPPVVAFLYVAWCAGFACGVEDTKRVLSRAKSKTESSKAGLENNPSVVRPQSQARQRHISIEEACGEMVCPDGHDLAVTIRASPLV
jgi:hypothetical protein